jgi:polyhydroxyalkanoate synthesis regulator phasin
MKFAYENRISIAEASKLLSNPEPARPPQLPRMHSTANPDQEMDDLKKEVAKLRSQIEAISVHHPQTTARLETLEITVQDIQEKIDPLLLF